LVWARETSGLTTEVAAQKADVSADRLAAWESGQQKPTFAQLRKLASVYKRPLAVFYLEEPPKGFAPMHDFRRSAGHAGLPNSPELTLEVRRAHDRRDWALELLEQLEERPRELNGALTLGVDPDTAAAEVRRILKVNLRDQISWRTNYDAFNQWRLLIERAGILTFQANDVETTEARGFSISERPLPVAVTNIKDAPRGRIFTLLHETAHILLRDGRICDLPESDQDEL
jgi:transcriptional regulator with XRE-family HTH domain